MWKYGNIKIFLQKVKLEIGLKKKFFWLKRLKTLWRGYMLLVILIKDKLLERFTKKNCKKTNQKKFRGEKLIRRKGNKL